MLSLSVCPINNIMELIFLCCQINSFRTILTMSNWPKEINAKGKSETLHRVARQLRLKYVPSKRCPAPSRVRALEASMYELQCNVNRNFLLTNLSDLKVCEPELVAKNHWFYH